LTARERFLSTSTKFSGMRFLLTRPKAVDEPRRRRAPSHRRRRHRLSWLLLGAADAD